MAKPGGFTDEELKAAQSKLDDLCQKYGMKPFEIQHKGPDSKKWQSLVLRMCGLNVVDPKWGARENEDTFEIGSHALVLLEFWEQDEETGKIITKEDVYNEVIEKRKLKPRDMPKGRKTKPRNAVKKALESTIKKRQKQPED